MYEITPVAEQGMFSSTENFAAHLAGKIDDLIEIVNVLQETVDELQVTNELKKKPAEIKISAQNIKQILDICDWFLSYHNKNLTKQQMEKLREIENLI